MVPRPLALGLGIAIALVLGTACSSDHIQDPGDDNNTAGFIVSTTGAAGAWASLRPGTVAAGVAAHVSNRTRGTTRDVFLFSGGFDPISLPAAAGDVLEFSVLGESGNTLLEGTGTVPSTRNPF